MSDENKITVLIVEPEKRPRIADIPETLEAMQSVVGGYIQEIMLFDDEVALVCNEEGKVNGLALNRALYCDDGKLMDIVAGTFFVCSAPFDSEKFESLTPEQRQKFMKRFEKPEMFFQTVSGIKVVPIGDKNKDYER